MSWKAEYAILIMVSTLIDYIAGIQISGTESNKKRKIFLAVSLIANLGMLFAFKYFNFFSDSTRIVLQAFTIPWNPATLKVLLPVGISFYTFQTMSYTIDIYKKRIQPEKHLGIFAVYVSFFPQLVAGPIERAKNLIPQIRENHSFEYKRVTDGMKLMLWGFFKKMVVADNLAIIVNAVYGNPSGYSGISLGAATVFFAFQIYADFSGYTDIAIGAAQIMGIKLMDNFNRPYISKSIPEFWRRWHISLSSWFKDYLYFPLGGNRVKIPRWYLNIFIVFLASGLWHGANWTFVVWGALHGFYIVFGAATRKLREGFFKATRFFKSGEVSGEILSLIKIAWTFILVNIGWVFFRSGSIRDAIYILTSFFTRLGPIGAHKSIISDTGLFGLIFVIGLVAFMEFVHLVQGHGKIRRFLDDKPLILRWLIYIAMLMMIIFLSKPGEQFIYFQF